MAVTVGMLSQSRSARGMLPLAVVSTSYTGDAR